VRTSVKRNNFALSWDYTDLTNTMEKGIRIWYLSLLPHRLTQSWGPKNKGRILISWTKWEKSPFVVILFYIFLLSFCLLSVRIFANHQFIFMFQFSLKKATFKGNSFLLTIKLGRILKSNVNNTEFDFFGRICGPVSISIKFDRRIRPKLIDFGQI